MAVSDTVKTIVMSPEPRGRFIEAIISGTPKPGTVMQLTTTAKVNGNFTYLVHNVGTAGDRPVGPIAVLLEDRLQGKTITDAYVTGTLGQLYFPLPGDELLMLCNSGEDIDVAEQLIIEDATGLLNATTGTVEIEPFVALEDSGGALGADTLLHVMFSGY